ncbi:MAG: dehydrogenase, partial [Cyclobacteriaceae bacterium]|nr:dehydrogenase [Cyclobacteriaceae bacterium]
MNRSFALLFILVSALVISCRDIPSQTNGVAPQDAPATFELAEGFEISLVVAEPLVADPVAMEIDENGDLYVVEMHGYPLDVSGSGIVKLITDSDGDGMPDKSVVFADSLVLPTGIMKWKRGVIVIDCPYVFYLEDTNQDGRADVRDTLLTGFAFTNPQHNANTPIFGLDNWIYIGNEGHFSPTIYVDLFDYPGSPMHFPSQPDGPQLPPNAGGRNVRIKPDQKQLEMMSGNTQYGQTFDPWGHQLGTSNADHLFHEVLAAKYLSRNPNLRLARATQDISDHGNASEVFPITINPEHQLLTDIGVITSSSGVTWYTGGLFPDEFNNVTFVAESVHNLVHADKLTDEGASFRASALYPDKEFLASTDSWSRPVNFYIGPDGALYMIDYYRQIIEHPEWMSEEVTNSGALYNGMDKGRIYRIVPKGTARAAWGNELALAGTQQLVDYLDHKNLWWRKNAQRLLLDSADDQTVDLLTAFIANNPSPAGWVHALWLLDELYPLPEELLTAALAHPAAGVRENAIRIAERHLNENPGLLPPLLALADDTHPKVRFQLLLTLGYLDDDRSKAVRQKLLFEHLDDEWMQVAALSSVGENSLALISELIKNPAIRSSDGGRELMKTCA